MEFRARLVKGEDFAKLAKESAEKDHGDPSAKDNGGSIGWFTVFQTVYPFETGAYNMKPGDLSMPVRTQFWLPYHQAEQHTSCTRRNTCGAHTIEIPGECIG